MEKLIDTRDELFAVMKVGDCAVIAGTFPTHLGSFEEALYERLEPVRRRTGFQFRVTPSLTGPEQVVQRTY